MIESVDTIGPRRRRRRRHPRGRRHAAAARARPDPTRTRSSRSSTACPPQSLYLRFHGARTVDRRLVEPFLDPDWVERGRARRHARPTASGRAHRRARELRAAARPGDGRGRLRRRRRGAGPRHRHAAARAARRARRRQRHPTLRRRGACAENRAMLARLRATPASSSRASSSSGEVELRFPIAPTEAFRERVEERDHVAVVRLAAAVLRAATRRRDRRLAPARLDRRRALPQHPRRRLRRRRLPRQPERRAGRRRSRLPARSTRSPIRSTWRSSACPARTRARAPRRRRSRRGVRALCVISAGFAETGAEGRERQERLLALVRAHGARLVGPNCLGIAVAGPQLNATFAPRAAAAGPHRLLVAERRARPRAAREGGRAALGFSAFVSIGNKADVSSNDLLEWWEDDPATDARAPLPRVVRQPAQVRARRPPRRAPQADPRAEGRHDRAPARAPRARTPPRSPARTRPSTRSSARPACCARETLEELVDAAALLSSQPLPRGRRVGVAHERRRPRHPLRRRLRGRRASSCRSSPTRRARRSRDVAAARGERRQPGRPARLRHRRDLRGGRCRRCSPTRASTR